MRLVHLALAVSILGCVMGAVGGCVTPEAAKPVGQNTEVGLRLEPADDLPRQNHPEVVERRWQSTGLAVPTATKSKAGAGGEVIGGAATVPFAVRLLPPRDLGGVVGDGEAFTLRIPIGSLGRPESVAGADEDSPVLLVLDRPGATFTFVGDRLPDRPGVVSRERGTARVTLRPPFVAAARRIEAGPTVEGLLRVAVVGVTVDELAQYRTLELSPNLTDIASLAYAGVAPEDIQVYYEAGYAFSTVELTQLSRVGVKPADAAAYSRAGLRYPAADLIRLQNSGVDPTYAIGMRDAGFAQDTRQITLLHNEGVEPTYAKRMRDLGVADNDAALIRLHDAGIEPERVAAYQQAGFKPSINELITLKGGGVSGSDAVAFKQAGYAFSQEDLLLLARWNVPREFVLSLKQPPYRALDAQRIVDLHLRRVTPEMVEVLRQPDAEGTVIGRRGGADGDGREE